MNEGVPCTECLRLLSSQSDEAFQQSLMMIFWQRLLIRGEVVAVVPKMERENQGDH